VKIGQGSGDRIRQDGWLGRREGGMYWGGVWRLRVGGSGGTCSMDGGTVVLGGISSMAGSGRKRRRREK
jgi:hypothetical protein